MFDSVQFSIHPARLSWVRIQAHSTGQPCHNHHQHHDQHYHPCNPHQHHQFMIILINSWSSSLQGYDSVFSATRCKKLRWEEMNTSGWVFALLKFTMDPLIKSTNFVYFHSAQGHTVTTFALNSYYIINASHTTIKQAIKCNPSLNTGAPKQSTSPQLQGQEGKTSKVRKATFKDKEVFCFQMFLEKSLKRWNCGEWDVLLC